MIGHRGVEAFRAGVAVPGREEVFSPGTSLMTLEAVAVVHGDEDIHTLALTQKTGHTLPAGGGFNERTNGCASKFK